MLKNALFTTIKTLLAIIGIILLFGAVGEGSASWLLRAVAGISGLGIITFLAYKGGAIDFIVRR